MTQNELYQEIRRMVEQGDLETPEAVRLLLLSHAQLLQEMVEIKEELAEQRQYPSLTWLWAYRRKDVILIIAIIFVTYTVLFSPWNISDIRQAVLHTLGLPADMGMGPSIPVTPIP